MRRFTLHVRSLTYHWRMNLAVALGVAVASAALTGALLVGDSMRQSLRDVALGRLGKVDHALVAPRYFPESLAERLERVGSFQLGYERAASLILLNGGATNAESRAHSEGVSIHGIDESFWNLGQTPGSDAENMPPRSVVINQALADELRASVGDDILLRMGKPSDVSTETLLGRRDETTAALRLPIHAIIPTHGLGAFSIKPQQVAPLNAFVPLETLQRAVDKVDRTNALLVIEQEHGDSPVVEGVRGLQRSLARSVTPRDLGLTIRQDALRGYVALESDAMLIDPVVERAARVAADKTNLAIEPVLTYLANRIEIGTTSGEAKMVPYSTVAAIEPTTPALARMQSTDAATPVRLEAGEVLLNAWAADDLNAKIGDAVSISYFVTGEDGRLTTEESSFTVAGIVALEAAADDPGWIPPYPGVTDTDNLADWNAPFPVDFNLIRDKDEAYWDEHRTTPKAFVTLADGQRLWAHDGGRLGTLTSIRIYPNDEALDVAASSFESALLEAIDVSEFGLRFEPVRQQAIEASKGSTDFGMLFVGFSFFLIISAAMLVALLFRLGVERRGKEVGLLLATGHTPQSVGRLLLTEGALIAAIGGAVGLVAAQTYAWLMLAGLRTWWSGAANAPFLKLYATPTSFAIGYGASIAVALVSIRWSIRGLTRQSTRSLLAGVTGGLGVSASRTARRPTIVAVTAFVVAGVCAVLPAMTDAVKPPIAFFMSGAAVLTACLAWLTAWMRRGQRGIVHTPGITAMIRLGIRNAPRNPSRSVLTVGLVASATFIIASLQAFRVETDEQAVTERSSGIGGYSLLAESASPLPYDLATRENADALNLSEETNALLEDTTILSFRLKPGDDSSCLSLYQAKRPRIIGASNAMIQRGGFTFASTLAESQAERQNPWLLLNGTFDDGAIPVIGDDSTVLWLLKLGLGKDLTITDERGSDVPLRFVALLKGSLLRNELVVAEPAFKKLFPSSSGKQFFLIDAPLEAAGELEQLLERDLAPFSLDVVSTRVRLNRYLAVQNTYLSTFQTLGGLGLVLGTLGLAAVMLRNIWERRKELALMRAIGFAPGALAVLVFAENTALLITGLLSGCLAAAVAVAPTLANDPGAIAWQSLGAILLGVLVFGLGTSAATLIPTMRARMIESLRTE